VKLRYTQWNFYYTKWMVGEASLVAEIVAFYFLSDFIGGSSVVDQYGGNYAAYLLLGVITNRFFVYLQEMLYSRPHEACRGSLQMYLLSPVGVWAHLLGSVAWVIIYWTAMSLLLDFGIGYLVLGLDVSLATDPFALLAVFSLSVISVVGLSFTSCSTFSLLNAKGYENPLRFFMGYGLQALIAGAYFPVALLPDWVQFISRLLPQYYAYRSLRLILLTNATWESPIVYGDIVVLALFSVVLMILGVLLFELGLRKAKKDGNLTRWV